MKKIRTEIRHDRIENDNRKNELQSKAKSGLKTAKADPEGKQETQKTAASGEIQTQLRQKAAEKSYENKQETQKTTANGEIHTQVMHDDTGYDRVESDNGINEPQGDSEDWLKADKINSESKPKAVSDGGIQTQIRHDDMESGLKTAVTKQETPKFKSSSGIQTQIKRNSIESSVKRDVIQNKAESGIKTKSGKVSNAKARIAGMFRAAATVGTVTSRIMQSAVPNGGDDMSSGTAGKVKESTFNAADKSFDAVRKFAEKKAKSAKKSSKWRNNAQNSSKVGKVKKNALDKAKTAPKAIGKAAGKTAKTVGRTAGTAARGVSSAVGTAQKIKGVSSGGDISGDFAEQTKAAAEKGAEIGFNVSKRVVRTVKKPVKAVKKKIKSASERTVKKAVKSANKRVIKTTAKTSAKVAKRTVKTSVKVAKTAVKTARAAIRATANAVKVAAHAIKAAVQATVHAVQAAVHAVVALMSTPVGWVILGVALVVVLIVIIFNMVSGAATVPVSVVSGMEHSLDWLFGDDTSADLDELAENYQEYLDMVHYAFEDVKGDVEDMFEGFGERDTLVFNGAEFYPASSGLSYVQSNMTMNTDPKYLIEVYYIYLLRSTDEPEITKEGLYGFMLAYLFEITVESEGGHSCPTADCSTTTWSHPDGYCTEVEEGEACPGHEVTFCPNNHKLITIEFKEVPDLTGADVLSFTEEELELLEFGLLMLDEILEMEDGG